MPRSMGHMQDRLTEEQRQRFREEHAALPRTLAGKVVKGYTNLLRRKWGISKGCARNILVEVNHASV